MNKVKSGYKSKYAMAKHHAWAGSVLLAILGATRWFTQDMDIQYNDLFFIIAVIGLISYILIALLFTYRFRTGLTSDQQDMDKRNNKQSSGSLDDIQANVSPKEIAKLEKKRSKNESKRLKKLAKAKEKQEKDSS
jgi:hypothetical protein